MALEKDPMSAARGTALSDTAADDIDHRKMS
jgi:hypothetical protein